MKDDLFIKTITVGPLSVNCYILGCNKSKRCAIIDPGAEKTKIIEGVNASGYQPELIMLTHGHIDHVAAVAPLKRQYELKVALHKDDIRLLNAPDIFGLRPILGAEPCPEPDMVLNDGTVINIGNLKISVLHTPGHTPGSCCFYINNHCFCGDTVFEGSVGRTDLPGSDFNKLMRSIKTKILSLDDHTILLPGHGPTTSVGVERERNPFFPR